MKQEVEFENAYIFLLCPWLVLFHWITFSAITFYSLHLSHVGQVGNVVSPTQGQVWVLRGSHWEYIYYY
jgi:hypothetical protein